MLHFHYSRQRTQHSRIGGFPIDVEKLCHTFYWAHGSVERFVVEVKASYLPTTIKWN